MVERRELITICRQIGTMMEVGVDFLRLTRALREQTDNPRLLELYDGIENDMRMGENLADAIAKAPDVFSPFAVSLIRQGEARGDVEGAWHRLADSLKQEAQEDKDLGLEPADSTKSVGPRGVSQVVAGEPAWMARLESASRRILLGGATFLATLCALWSGAQAGAISWRAMVPLQLLLAALWLFVVALWPANRGLKARKSPPVGEVSPMVSTLQAISSQATSSQTTTAATAPIADFNIDLEGAAKRESARTEELLRNFAPTFSVVETNPAEREDLEDPQNEATPNSEKRFQL